MAEAPEPLDAFRDDVEHAVRRRWRDARWWLGKWAGAQLVKLVGAGAISAGLLWAAFPYAAAAAATAIIVLLAGYTIYVRKQLVDERTLRRRAWISGRRLQQQVLKHEVALAEATLILAGQPQDRRSRFDLRAPGSSEFVSAVRYAETRAASVTQGPQPATAARRGAAPRVPSPPQVDGVRRRRDLRKSEIAKLEAEIQCLSTRDAIDLARAAEEAERSYKQQRDDAHRAERAARDRYRAGRTPSPAQAGHALEIRVTPNGERDVREAAPAPTPEQIANGKQLEDQADRA